MENRSHALIAGLFTLVFGLSAAFIFWWFNGQHEENSQYLVLTKRDVTGLNVQGQVRYRGIRVGQVDYIELDAKDVSNTLIHIQVRSDIPITRGTTAKLGYQGITGIAHILLEDSGKDEAALATRSADAKMGRLPSDQFPRIPMQDSLIQELSDVGGETLRQARDFLQNANEVLNQDNRANMAKIFQHLEATTENAQATSALIQKMLAPENLSQIKATLTNIEKTSAQSAPLLIEARQLVARLQSVSEKLDAAIGAQSANGTSALVPRINNLTKELSANSQQLNRVLRMLEDSPQSLIFGRETPAPGPGEAGFIAPDSSKEQP